MRSASISLQGDPRSMKMVTDALEGYPAALQDKAVRAALRRWCKGVQMAASAATKKKTGAVARSLNLKVKAYDRGRIMWAAVGHNRKNYGDIGDLKGRAKRAIYDTDGGWRAHFVEFGFHQWSPSWSMNDRQRSVIRNRRSKFGTGRGSGWRLGRYHRGRGTFYRGTAPLLKAGKANAGVLLPLILSEAARMKQRIRRAALKGKI